MQPKGAQVCGHPARAATEIRHGSQTVGPHELGEGPKDGPVQGLGGKLPDQELGVVGRDRVVGRLNGAKIGKFGDPDERTGGTSRSSLSALLSFASPSSS